MDMVIKWNLDFTIIPSIYYCRSQEIHSLSCHFNSRVLNYAPLVVTGGIEVRWKDGGKIYFLPRLLTNILIHQNQLGGLVVHIHAFYVMIRVRIFVSKESENNGFFC